MGDPGRLDHPRLLEPDTGADAVEQALAVAEENGDDVQLELVDQARGEVLPGDAGAAGDQDVLLAGGGSRPLQSGLDPVGDEVELVPPSISSGSRG